MIVMDCLRREALPGLRVFVVDPNDSTCHDVNHCDLSISLF